MDIFNLRRNNEHEKKILIDGVTFRFKVGIRLLKSMHSECPDPALSDIWRFIAPMTFKEINSIFQDLNEKRIAFKCLGIEEMLREIQPVLVSSATLPKTTTWVQPDGSMEQHRFNDTYEIYRVSSDELYHRPRNRFWRPGIYPDHHFVKCRDTSTGKEYVIWVDLDDVFSVNARPRTSRWYKHFNMRLNVETLVTPIEAIAWTIMTDVPVGGIQYVLRQGDCVFVRPHPECTERVEPRHLTGKEYQELMLGES